MLPAHGHGQLAELLRAVANGGTWTELPIERGQGSYRSPVLPLAGLSLAGCLRVWEGHSGNWTIRAEDKMGSDKIDVQVAPGEDALFRYRAGFRAQIEIAAEWSEPRDTTLFVWIGIARSDDSDVEPACEPPAEGRPRGRRELANTPAQPAPERRAVRARAADRTRRKQAPRRG